MLLFGHPLVESPLFYHIAHRELIDKTPPNSCIYLESLQEDADLALYCKENGVVFALYVTDLTEIILAHNIGASYIFVPKKLAKSAQNIAENYLFDAKILTHIDDEKEIEEYALLGIDGVVFTSAIVKVSG